METIIIRCDVFFLLHFFYEKPSKGFRLALRRVRPLPHHDTSPGSTVTPPPSGSVTHRTVQVGPPSSNRDTLHNITALLTTTNRLHNRPLVMDDLWKSRRRIKNAGNKRHRKKRCLRLKKIFVSHYS